MHKNFDNAISGFFYNERWPEYFFVNSYPLLVVIWNLFLLSVPFLLFFILKKTWQGKKDFRFFSKGGMIFFLWLIFLPNTAYVITDVRHLLNFCPLSSSFRVCLENAWMIIFFFVYASFGWLAFVFLLKQMKNFLDIVFNKKFANIFIVLIVPLISLGVLLGLIDRFNSWEFFLYPITIFENILKYFTQADYFKNLFAFSLGFYILYFIGDKFFKDYK